MILTNVRVNLLTQNIIRTKMWLIHPFLPDVFEILNLICTLHFWLLRSLVLQSLRIFCFLTKNSLIFKLEEISLTTALWQTLLCYEFPPWDFLPCLFAPLLINADSDFLFELFKCLVFSNMQFKRMKEFSNKQSIF